MLEEFLMPILEEEVPMTCCSNKTFPHSQKEVTDFLNLKFPEKWIGRGGPFTWPPLSPDLTPIDFFLLGVLQGHCFLATIGYNFAGTCWEDKRYSGYGYPRLAL
jgi:hypothetical protein